MSKVNYRRCDICGETLVKNSKGNNYLNGYRIWNRLFNKLDICNTCMGKIKQLSIDSKEEEKYVKELFDKHNKYEDFNLESIYLQGVEDMLDILSHNRLRNIKIKK